MTEEYEIRVGGHLDAHWASFLGDLDMRHGFDERGFPVTTLSGSLQDQAGLYGALLRVRDIGAPIVAVTRKEPESN